MTTDFNKLTVMELRAELKKYGLVQTGKKADLVERLTEAVQGGASEDANKETIKDEQPEKAQDSPRDGVTPTPDEEPTAEGAAKVSPEQVSAPDESNPDAPRSVDVTFTTNGNEAAQTNLEPPSTSVNEQPPAAPVAITTISIDQETGETMPPVTEVINDVQSRKRRSRTPSIDGSVRKRLRPDDPEPRQLDAEMADEPRDPAEQGAEPVHVEGVDSTKEPSENKEEPIEPKRQPDEPTARLPDAVSSRERDSGRYNNKPEDDVAMEEKYDSRPDFEDPPRESYQAYPARRMEMDEPAEPYYSANDRPVVPAIHPATSALYIKNFMRPLRADDVKDHIIALATPPSKELDVNVVVDFYLDPIRTHAFVSFNSISAASRVRSALHDQVWPDERNRKALWVDFIPAEKVVEWIDREEAGGGGRGKMNRWEVVYEHDEDGIMAARLEEGGPETSRPNPRSVAPPTGPASTAIPTGPSQPSASGIQGAPTGPRGRGGRMPPGYPLQGGVTPQEGVKATRAHPSLLYKPQPEDVALRRIDNMRSYYTKDKYRDMGPVEDINRYTFEDADRFVDRGREVFIGIRPPHRERQMRGGPGGGNGGGRGPRGPRRGGPPPPSFRPRGDRYMGGGGGGGGGRDSGRDSFAPPRSRLDGAPLPTFEAGRSDRRGRNGFGGYGR